jgi:hypothetical protein
VTGQVVSSSFLPVMGANITYSVNGTLLWTLSDAMGDFSVQVPNGTYTFTATYPGDHPGRTSVLVSGSNVNAGQITLNTENRLVVAQPTMSPPRSDVGRPVNFSAIITGGTPPYAVIWNGLPSGCASADSASVQCTPSDAGTFNITVQATDATNAVVVGPTLEATIVPALAVTMTAFPARLFTGQVFNLTANATGGIPPLSYAWSGLPNGCLSTDTALISCFPTYAGLYNVSVTVSDDIGNSVSATAGPVSILGLQRHAIGTGRRTVDQRDADRPWRAAPDQHLVVRSPDRLRVEHHLDDRDVSTDAGRLLLRLGRGRGRDRCARGRTASRDQCERGPDHRCDPAIARPRDGQ